VARSSGASRSDRERLIPPRTPRQQQSIHRKLPEAARSARRFAAPSQERRITRIRGDLLRRGVELAISDAADDAVVRPYLRRVTEHRIDYLEERYLALGFSPDEERHRALLVYTTPVGTWQLHLLSTLVPEIDGG
jgi:hypothetical protein